MTDPAATSNDDPELQRALVRALLGSGCFAHPVSELWMLETHISWVILTGEFAYKIKKPLDLGFLDFATLKKRRAACLEELRLNRRLAPEIYLDVLPVTGSLGQPRMGGDGEALEWAVRMRQFPQEGLLDRLAGRDALPPPVVDAIAEQVAAFHARIDAAQGDSPYGSAQQVQAPVAQNFEQMEPLVPAEYRQRLEAVRCWSADEGARLAPTFEQRRREGHVRECHGDLHLGNMALLEDRVVIFDCIEFNPDLRWTDTMAEAAFLVMDLHRRGQAPLARRFLDAYLQASGDYRGVVVLRYYLVYRAMVRAKIALIRGAQAGANEADRNRAAEDFLAYLSLAEAFLRPLEPRLVVLCGLSASGKSRNSLRLIAEWDAVRLRTDVERKRQHGLAATQKSGSTVGAGIYSAQATRRLYESLKELAVLVVQAGWPVLVDGTFLKAAQRAEFRDLARELGVPFAILQFDASVETLRARVRRRMQKAVVVSEAGEEVLERQLRDREPLTAEEQRCAVVVSTEDTPDIGRVLADLLAIR